MAPGSFTALVRRLLPIRPACRRCGRGAGGREHQVWAGGDVFCSTYCCESWRGEKLYFG